MRVVVGAPYPEGSTVAIAQSAARRGELEKMFLSGYTGVQWRTQALPLKGLQGYWSRRVVSGVPPEHVHEVATAPEFARAVVGHVPGLASLGSRTMYAAKMLFDRQTARKLVPTDAFVGVYGSAALSFRAAHKQGILTVLNFVNSHPAEHNRYLRELGGLREGREFVPDRVARRVEREIASADLILVPSDFVARQLAFHSVPPERIGVIAYGTDTHVFRPTPVRETENGRIRCLFAGQISHRKGIPVLLKAARRLPQVEFVLVGPMVSRETLRDIPPNVAWRGPLRHGAVAEAMRRVDIFILPSVEDSFGLVATEAMASGLPVVVTDNVGCSELIIPGVTGFVVRAGDPAALASAVGHLAGDADLRARVGDAARTEMSKRLHSWDEYGATVLSTIEWALSRRRTVQA